jgi:hypothetical protein
MDDNKNVKFIDDAEFQFQQKTKSIEEVILSHIKKISEIACQEFTEGYWQKKPVKVGGAVMVVETYFPDLNEAYSNAIDFLVDIAYPKSDEDFRTILKKLEEKEEVEYKESKEKERPYSEWKRRKVFYRRKILKELFLMFERTDFFSGEEDYEE